MHLILLKATVVICYIRTYLSTENMDIYNYTEARQNFKTLLDNVANDRNCAVIVRRDAEDAIIMSKSHYDSLMETVYLLKSPANAQHLAEAISEHQAGKTTEHDLIDA